MLSKLQMNYYPDQDSHIIDKVKVVFELPNYATKKEWEHGRGLDTSDLIAKKIFLLWKLKLKN